MTLNEIRKRRLEIAVEMGRFAERDCELRRQMLEVEAGSTALSRESAELDLEENEWAGVIARRERESVKAAHGNRHNGEDTDGS